MKPMPAWFVSDAAAMAAISLQPIYIMLAARGFGADSYVAGLIASASVLIKLVFGIVGGAAVDVGDRRVLMIASGALQACIWLLFAVLVFFGVANAARFSVCALGSALVWGVLGGAADAALRGIAQDETEYVQTKTACEGRNSAIGLVCSPLGAALYCVSPMAVPIAQAVLFAVAAGFAAALPSGESRRKLAKSSDDRAHKGAGVLLEGFAWVIRQRRIMRLLVTASLINFAYQVWQYGLQYVLLDSGQSGLSISVLDMASCAGVMLGACVAMRRENGATPEKAIHMVLIALLGASVCLLLRTGGSLGPALALFIFSLPMPRASASMQGEIFIGVPDAMQGRARSVLNVAAQGFALIAPLAASHLAGNGAYWAISSFSLVPVLLGVCLVSGHISNSRC